MLLHCALLCLRHERGVAGNPLDNNLLQYDGGVALSGSYFH
jgi:hypothetical protein